MQEEMNHQSLAPVGPCHPWRKMELSVFLKAGDSIVIKMGMAAMVPKLAVCLKVDIIVPLHTDSVDRRCSAWAKEWW